jgi:hypothetical protein
VGAIDVGRIRRSKSTGPPCCAGARACADSGILDPGDTTTRSASPRWFGRSSCEWSDKSPVGFPNRDFTHPSGVQLGDGGRGTGGVRFARPPANFCDPCRGDGCDGVAVLCGSPGLWSGRGRRPHGKTAEGAVIQVRPRQLVAPTSPPAPAQNLSSPLSPFSSLGRRPGVFASLDPVVYTHLQVAIRKFSIKRHTICARPFVQRMTAKMDQEACDV